MTNPLDNATTMDKLVIGALTLISLALIVGAIVRDDTVYLGYLAGTAAMGFLYAAFIRPD